LSASKKIFKKIIFLLTCARFAHKLHSTFRGKDVGRTFTLVLCPVGSG
jgi:hypothetical protein